MPTRNDVWLDLINNCVYVQDFDHRTTDATKAKHSAIGLGLIIPTVLLNHMIEFATFVLASEYLDSIKHLVDHMYVIYKTKDGIRVEQGVQMEQFNDLY